MRKALFADRMWVLYIGAMALLIFLSQCKKSTDLNLSLAVNADSLHLDTAAGKTHIMIYATGDWKVGFEKDTNWISINKTEGHGNSDVEFSYSKNSGPSRTVTLIITKGSEQQKIRIVQDGVAVQLRFGQTRFTIPKQGLKTVLPVISNIEGAYKSVKIDYLYDDETMEKWVTKDSITKNGYVFNALDNNSGRERAARIYLTIIDAQDVEHTAYTDVTQSLTSAFLQQKNGKESRITKDPKIDTVILKGNVGAQFPSFQKKVTYIQGSDWIEDVSLIKDSLLLIAVRANNSGVNRNADIDLTLSVNGANLIDLKHHVFQSNSDFEEQNFEDLRAMITAPSGSLKMDAALKAVKGIVISEAGNPNMETNNQTGFKTIDLEDAPRTAYIESLDGKYGFRLKFATKEANVLERYSTVTIAIDGLTLLKEANPGRYTITGLKAGNIVEAQHGSASDLIAKSRLIGDLTENDLYTFVTLKEVSVTVPYGSYMNINRGYALKTNWNGLGTTAPYVDATPTNIYDAKGDHMNVLVNVSAPWALGTLPKKSGTIAGIVTHSNLVRYGAGDGNIGMYQIRPVNDHDIKMTGAPVATTLVEWNWLNGGGTNTCATGKINLDADGDVMPLTGSGKLSCTVADVAASNGFNPVCNGDPNSKAVYNNGLQFTNVKWWNTTRSKGEGFQLKFPTTGVSARYVVINFSINGGSGTDASNHIPVYWEIQYSFDGANYTAVPNSSFTVRPLVQWNTDRPYETAGLTPYSFKLPNSILGRSNVYVRIVAKSDVCAGVGSPAGGEAGHITASMAGTTMRVGCISVKYIQ